MASRTPRSHSSTKSGSVHEPRGVSYRPHSPSEAPPSATPPTDVRGPVPARATYAASNPMVGQNTTAPKQRAGRRESKPGENAAWLVSPANVRRTQHRCRKGLQSSRVSTNVVPGRSPPPSAHGLGEGRCRATGQPRWPTPPSHASQSPLVHRSRPSRLQPRSGRYCRPDPSAPWSLPTQVLPRSYPA